MHGLLPALPLPARMPTGCGQKSRPVNGAARCGTGPDMGNWFVQRAMVWPDVLAHCFSRLNQAASIIEGYPLDPRLEALRGLTFLVETDST